MILSLDICSEIFKVFVHIWTSRENRKTTLNKNNEIPIDIKEKDRPDHIPFSGYCKQKLPEDIKFGKIKDPQLPLRWHLMATLYTKWYWQATVLTYFDVYTVLLHKQHHWNIPILLILERVNF